jgi:ring-1,2-phenylacetyl-CoA epoxidase subunit PaaC
VALYGRLVSSRDAQLAAIAAKALKEVRYHQRFSRGWLERLGNGTALSAQRMQDAVDNLWRFTGELFQADALEIELSAQGIAVDPRELQAEWQATVHTALIDAGLQIPKEAAFARRQAGAAQRTSRAAAGGDAVFTARLSRSAVVAGGDYATSG